MMGWIIGGAVVLFLLSRNAAPAPSVQMSPLARPLPVATAPDATLAAAIPAVVLPSTVAQQPVIISGGNEPLVPLSASAAAAINKDAIGSLETGINWSLQNQISMEKAMGIYTGYGVPLSGPGFAPLSSTDAGTFIIDSGSVGFSAGPLAG